MSVACPDWLGVEFRHLAALDAIAREGSFSRAATSLGYTQSAVSSQLATLERLVGARLVDRLSGPRHVALTESGHALLAHARAMAEALAEAREAVASYGRGERCVRIGFFDGVGAAFLPPLVHAAASADPEPTVCPREARTSDDLLDLVEGGLLDLALVVLPVRRDAIRTQLVLRDAYDVLLPPGHELADDEGALPLAALRGLPLVLYGADGQARRLRRALERAGAPPGEALELSDPPTIGGLVRAGVAPAIVPRLVAEACDDLPSRALAPALPPRLIAVAHSGDRELTDAAALVVTALREAAAEREDSEPDRAAAAVG